MIERVWVVLTTDELGWRSLAGVGATREAAERIVADLHLGEHAPDLERFDDGSVLCRIAVSDTRSCGVQINPAEVKR